VVNDHRIIERGTHDELLAQGGFYSQLYMKPVPPAGGVGVKNE
jgi:ABC-type bacteriocin/lantibiotic exporter with double-glycine peptidase domain